MQRLRFGLATLSYLMFLMLFVWNSSTSPLAIMMATIASLAYLIYIISAFREWSIYSNQANKRVVIPEFQLEQAKFYQLGMLMDGNFTDQDLLATLIFYTLHPPQQPDKIEKLILNSASAHTIATLDRMLQDSSSQTEEERINNIATKLKKQIYTPIYQSMKSQQMFRYNPAKYKLLPVLVLILGPIAFFLLSLSGNIALAFLALFTSFTLSSVAWGLLWLNFENHTHTNSLKNKALGYKMYLARVEWYTVEKDHKAFERHLPYFLLFNLKKDKYTELINYTLKKLQIG